MHEPAYSDTPAGWSFRTRALIGLIAVIIMAPAYIYYSSKIGLGGNSDSAINVLQGWDMVNGRPILQGWVQGNNSWMTNELIVYAFAALFFGPTPTVIYVAHGFLYALVMVLVWLLGTSRFTKRGQILLGAVLTGAMLVHITRDTAWMTLSIIDHFTTSIPLLVMLILLDRVETPWKRGLIVFLTLTWATTSDHMAVYVGVLPVLLVAGLRMYFRKDGRRANAMMIMGALAVLPADSAFKSLIEALGGASRNNPPAAIFAPVDQLPANLWETIHSIMLIFGGGIFGLEAAQEPAQMIHLAIVAAAVAAWVTALRSLKQLSMVDQLLITAIMVNILAFMFSTMPGPHYTAHEILVVLPFSVALAVRLFVPRLTTLRTKLPVYAGLAMATALLAHSISLPANPDPTIELTRWLQKEKLASGVASFWQAASVTVQSEGTIQVSSIINDGHGNITPFWQVMRDDWYDPNRYDARFVISSRSDISTGNDALAPELQRKVFGPPERVEEIGAFRVTIYNYNILTKLPKEMLPHQRWL